MDNDYFIKVSSEIHLNKYDYSLTDVSEGLKVKIICPIHGQFKQSKYLHIKGANCPLCSGHKSFNKEWFLKRANEVHGEKYDYSKVNYININTKVSIICPIHGEFEQKPNYHINNKAGCPKCGRVKCSGRYDTEEFIVKANKVHGYKYDYSATKYVIGNTKVKIICPVHGEFEQIARDHINSKAGCPKCASEENAKKLSLGYDDFVLRSNEIHKGKYDYSSVKYINNHTKVNILCPEHGIFRQSPSSHLQGHGCTTCCSSIKQKQIREFVELNGFNVIENNRNIISPYELDMVIDDINIAIEFHGLYYHSYDRVETPKEKQYHATKCNMCENEGYQLIQIFENEWDDKRQIVESIIKSKLNKNDRIYARNCEITQISSNDVKIFMDENHLQAGLNCKIAYGLKHNNELVCAIGIKNHNIHEYEISRFACKLGVNVVGGAGRLFKRFIDDYNPKEVLSYADRRFSNGNLYKKLGFKLLSCTKPNYFYIKKNNVYSRQKFQKHKLHKKLADYDSRMTESENMFNNKYRRIWDAGHLKFMWNK